MEKQQNNEMMIETPAGTFIVYASKDPNNPGVYVDFRRVGDEVDIPLVLVEHTQEEADIKGGHVITRVWGDALQEDYSDRIVHEHLSAIAG